MINKVKVGDTSHDINDARIGTFETSLSSNSNTSVPSSKAVADYVSSQMTSVLTYKGTIGSSGATVTALPTSHKVGDVYVVATAGTYAGKAVEVGDYIICKTAGTSANNAHWDVVNGENQVENKSASLAAAGSSATIATIDGTDITVTTPSTWKLTDTNTKVTSAANHYAPSADANSELTAAISGTAGTYALNTEYTVLTGVKAQRDEKGHVTGLTYTAQKVKDTNTTYSSKTAASGGTDVSLVTTGEKYTWNNKSDLAIGTTASTAAAGNHTHTTSLAADSGTSTVNLAANTTYKLTAGGTSVIFKTPADNNTSPGSLITNATTAQTASSGEAMSGNITLHKVSKTGSYNDLNNKPTIPAAVDENTVSGWGFTKNAGTITGITMNGASKGTSGVVDLGTVLTNKSAFVQSYDYSINPAGGVNAICYGNTNLHSHWTTAGPAFLYGANTNYWMYLQGDALSDNWYLRRNGGDAKTILHSGNISSYAEVTSNKVTSLSSSSTDTQYPSAKCVYDMVGNIETLLAAI